MTLQTILRAVVSAGIAHNNGAGGQFILAATERQLLALEARVQKRDRPLPPLPDGKGTVRHARHADDDGGWVVDFDCEGPNSYQPDDGEELFTADQMREYARGAKDGT